jgi:ABC-type multidrug transport system fused ATPase/permease subunit
MFGLLLFGVFMPFQVVLLPMSQVLGWLGMSSSIGGLMLVHCLAGWPAPRCSSATTTPPSRRAGQCGAHRRRGFWQIFWRIVLPLSTPIVVVTLIWQFTNIWNDFLFGVVFSGTDSKPITVGLNNLANTSSSVKEYNVDMAAAIIAGLPTMAVYVLAGKFFVRGLTPARSRVEGRQMASSLQIHQQALRRGDNSVEVLKRIDIHVEPGEFLILVGPSGCGKSTLLNMIAGLDDPSEGEIRIGDRNVTHAPRDRDIAMVFQSYALYPTMSAENIGFALEMRKIPKAERSPHRPGGRHAADRAPAGPPPSQLSGGQRQRVAMGRALARTPAVPV